MPAGSKQALRRGLPTTRGQRLARPSFQGDSAHSVVRGITIIIRKNRYRVSVREIWQISPWVKCLRAESSDLWCSSFGCRGLVPRSEYPNEIRGEAG
jgi:hypothetical protein